MWPSLADAGPHRSQIVLFLYIRLSNAMFSRYRLDLPGGDEGPGV